MITALPSSILLFLFVSSSINCKETATASTTFRFTNETDHQALLAIKNSILEDPFGTLSSWNNSLHFCHWQGVTCGLRHQRVTALKLSSGKLAGSLSPHLWNLTFLRIIDVSNNSLQGTLPQEVGRLFRLRSLYLINNSFHGEIPGNLSRCANLRAMSLNGNNFWGKIPVEIGSLSKLYILGLAYNNLTGPIPSSFANLSSLGHLSLMENNVEGSIPAELASLSKLEFLQLSSNKLSGMVPKQLYNTSSIYFLSLADNRLSGRLPPDIGLTLPNLQNLYLGKNQFTGPIPPSIANASRLVQVDMGDNALTGPIPENLGTLLNLQAINFCYNPLGNNNNSDLKFLTSLTNCTKLNLLWFYNSQLSGVLPNSIANLSTNLNSLRLDMNYITGEIPLEIGNLRSLEYLDLVENQLTGSIPDSVGKLSKLQQFHVFTNKISGEIPSSFGNITLLYELTLANNLLEGKIPVALANCTDLQVLDLSLNHLSGVIPDGIFGLSSLIGLALASNAFRGPLPTQVGNMTNLYILEVSENRLSGTIPSTLGYCIMLDTLTMAGNYLDGTIPLSFAQLRSIRFLDLSRNNLSGQIPKFLGELPAMQFLNLSSNRYDGDVPTEGVFRNSSAFSVAGNTNLCGGIKSLQLPACPPKTTEKKGKHLSHRTTIIVSTVAVFVFLLLACLCAFICWRRSMKSSRSSSTSPLEKKYLRLSYADLVHATDGFSSANMIGDGRYGTVYKGKLTRHQYDGLVAVKVLKLQERGASKTFVAECEAMRRIRHRNLVKIITSCSTIDFRGNDFKALIFEFMPNGCLESWLHPSSRDQEQPRKLGLLQRLNIAVDVAVALDYLHNHCETPVVHCDLKPSNILLGEDFVARVGDFGLARIMLAATGESVSAESSSIGIKGTIGYVAPEYGMGGEVSTHGDVYSYGILLLEMFTGKRPTDSIFAGSINLPNVVKTAIPERVMEIIDPTLTLWEEGETSRRTNQSSSADDDGRKQECLASILRVGVQCSAELPRERLDLPDVVAELNAIRHTLAGN